MGYNRKTPQAILYGPKEFGGAAIPHLYTECRIQQITAMMMHIRAATDLGSLFMINLNWTQLHIGLGSSCFEMLENIPYVDNWFFGIRDFLQKINGKLLICDMYIPKLERINDQFIMRAVLDLSPSLSANQLRHIDNWRFYFQVQTLSDLTNAKGDSILDVYMTHPTDPDVKTLRSDQISCLDWPHQPPPTSIATFKLWVRTLKRCFLHPTDNFVRTALGKWTIPVSSSQSHWQAYITQNQDAVIIRHESFFHCHSVIMKSTATTIKLSCILLPEFL